MLRLNAPGYPVFDGEPCNLVVDVSGGERYGTVTVTLSTSGRGPNSTQLPATREVTLNSQGKGSATFRELIFRGAGPIVLFASSDDGASAQYTLSVNSAQLDLGLRSLRDRELETALVKLRKLGQSLRSLTESFPKKRAGKPSAAKKGAQQLKLRRG